MVAYLIEAHELNTDIQFEELAEKYFPIITEQYKKQLIACAKILQDADRLDILRYDIENPNFQRFQPERLNNYENTKLISAVIELNTRQAIKNGCLQIKEGKIEQSGIKEIAKLVKENEYNSEFDNKTINSDLQRLANETSIFRFNRMSNSVKKLSKAIQIKEKEMDNEGR